MELIATDRSLYGIHLTSRPSIIRLQQELGEERRLAEALDRAADLGITRILCSAHPMLVRLLKAPSRRKRFKVWAVVPDFQQYVRDTSHHGTTGAALRRVLKMPFLHYRHLACFGLTHIPAMAGMRFEALMNLFLIAEISPFFKAGLDVERIALHRQITDLAIMLDQKKFFDVFLDMVRSQFDREPVFLTQNLAALREFVGNEPSVIAPVNSKRFLMGNSAARLRELAGKELIADHWDLEGTVKLEEALQALKASNVNRATIELDRLLDSTAGEHLAQTVA